MKIKLFILMFVLVFGGDVIVSTCGAAQMPYLGINTSVVGVPDIDLSGADFRTRAGLGIGIVGGYDFGPFRVEGELTHRKNNVDEVRIRSWGYGARDGDGDITSSSFLVNGYFDFENESQFTPYAGLGIGAARIAFNDVEAEGIDLVDDETTVAAAQMAVGFRFPVTEFVAIDISYRYFFTDEIELTNEFGNDVDADSYDSHNIVGGVRLSF